MSATVLFTLDVPICMDVLLCHLGIHHALQSACAGAQAASPRLSEAPKPALVLINADSAQKSTGGSESDDTSRDLLSVRNVYQRRLCSGALSLSLIHISEPTRPY